MDLAKITILENHRVQTGSVAPLAISIDGQNGVDELAFEVPAGMEDWAWRVEIEQGGKKTWRLLDAGNVWAIRAGEVAEGYARMQLVGSRTSGEDAEVWKSREFDVNVLPAINAAEAMEPGEASEFDRIAAEVKSDADRADAAAIRAEDAAAGAENIVNMAISDIEAEGQKQAAAVASSGTQALEAIGQVEQTAIAQVQAAGTAQVGAVEDAGDSKLAEIDAANAHVPQINETTGKWQVWDAQTGAYVDTDTDAQGPRGETGATGPQGPAGADGIGLPAATAEDAGKVPVVGADGSYTLGDPVPEVDATLTEAGAPADAAAVGEAIEAISPDDAAVDGKPWTSKHIVDMLCPPLEASGNPVQCYPVAGYPLGVKASWGPRQEGEGDPSPDNVRQITGLDEVTVTLSDGVGTGTTATLSLPSTVYGGEVDLVTGEGGRNVEIKQFDGTENWEIGGKFLDDASDWYYQMALYIDEALDSAQSAVAASHYPVANVSNNNRVQGAAMVWKKFRIRWGDTIPADVQEWKAYLAAQYAAGTPVTVAYKLATPQPITATGGQPIYALTGENVLLTNADSLTVTGRADHVATVQALADRVAALEQAAVN